MPDRAEMVVPSDYLVEVQDMKYRMEFFIKGEKVYFIDIPNLPFRKRVTLAMGVLFSTLSRINFDGEATQTVGDREYKL